jgi:hypothetical protein
MNLKIELIWLADKLDRVGLSKEAGIIDLVIKKASSEGWLEDLEGPREFAGARGALVSPGALAETLDELGGVESGELGGVESGEGGCPSSSFDLDSLLRQEDRLSEA